MFGKVNFFVDTILQRKIDRQIIGYGQDRFIPDDLSPLGACLECAKLLRDLIEMGLRGKATGYHDVHGLRPLLQKAGTFARFRDCIRTSSRIEAVVRHKRGGDTDVRPPLLFVVEIFLRTKDPTEKKRPGCVLMFTVDLNSGTCKLYNIEFSKLVLTS